MSIAPPRSDTLVWLTPVPEGSNVPPAGHKVADADAASGVLLGCGLTVTGGQLTWARIAETSFPRWCPTCFRGGAQ